MKIVKVGYHCCVRLQKQAIALLAKGHKVHLIGNQLPIGVDWTSSTYFATVSQLRESLRLHKDADIIHVHNEPSWMVMVAKEILPNTLVILDIHDSMAYRSNKIEYKSSEERVAFDMADGLVFVNEKCRQITNAKKPSCVLAPYVNEQHYAFQGWQWVGGVAYEGRIDVPAVREYMQYANYVDTCNQFKEAGIPFYIYAPKSMEGARNKCYKSICNLCTPLPYDSLIETMGSHDWGLCGNVNKHQEWDVALPNKLFEYMAAGIPIIAMNCKEVAKFVKKYKVGIVVKNIDEIKEKWDERAECQKNVFLKRFEFSMESQIHILEKLYKELL